MYRLKASREVAQPNHGLIIVDNLPTGDMHHKGYSTGGTVKQLYAIYTQCIYMNIHIRTKSFTSTAQSTLTAYVHQTHAFMFAT